MSNDLSHLTRDILQILDDMIPQDTSKTTKSLTIEIGLLKEDIEKQNARLLASRALLEEIMDIIRITTKTAELFKRQNINAESVWASFWGILKECDEAIFEMDSVGSRDI
ncbi:hypothetical protein FOMG_15992 [Fusarium oxysporum f. sp. melonis 26406]|uniref:Uncharacterized protein n=3 Tax=Fusarium oxysporum TaxID=5507 RepID=W9Z6M2_FUSOX|nr:hypothetical protein FOZG_17164 [Fusarium oxysporum Fo47]EWZ77447.1 hypothetical protein FOWG_18141 [Fusarium oxysporum f. sp. lycopersici MN25]EXA28745.1 hypothetical protein FOVG_19670 [Fusarium oxysporum f. sp. pisi HDV247]EXK27439.1 hypothetical protein FOMG_15992 [Fusarium oxysporum f. sp. melonis 26406]KAH7207409.1 hypothetical protein DER44DRAFT_826324 [Fusarium oxysporum]